MLIKTKKPRLRIGFNYRISSCRYNKPWIYLCNECWSSRTDCIYQCAERKQCLASNLSFRIAQQEKHDCRFFCVRGRWKMEDGNKRMITLEWAIHLFTQNSSLCLRGVFTTLATKQKWLVHNSKLAKWNEPGYNYFQPVYAVSASNNPRHDCQWRVMTFVLWFLSVWLLRLLIIQQKNLFTDENPKGDSSHKCINAG